MYIVIDLFHNSDYTRHVTTKENAKKLVRELAQVRNKPIADFRIYDTERHVTIRLVRKTKTKIIFEAYVYNTDYGTYRSQLFTDFEAGKRWCESQGANPDWWRVSADVFGKANQRISPKSFGVKPKELR